MGNASALLGAGFHIPPPVILWSRWDTLATIGLLLGIWLVFNYIAGLPD